MTINIEELEQRAKALQDEVTQLKAVIEEAKKPKSEGVWQPKLKEEYYIVNLGGFAWRDDRSAVGDEYRLETFPVFKTEEEAEFYAKHLKALEKLRKLAGDQSWIDWSKGSQIKYFLSYDHIGKKLRIDCSWEVQLNLYYFKTDKAANAAISQFTEEEAKALFLVK